MNDINVTYSFSFHSDNKDTVDRRLKVINQRAPTTNTNKTCKESFTVKPQVT